MDVHHLELKCLLMLWSKFFLISVDPLSQGMVTYLTQSYAVLNSTK